MNKSNNSQTVKEIEDSSGQFLFDLGEQPVRKELTPQEKADIQAELDGN
jgi:hypothetical protein